MIETSVLAAFFADSVTRTQLLGLVVVIAAAIVIVLS